MEFYTRICPKCGDEITHRNKYARNQCEKSGRHCQSCAAKDRIEKFGNNDAFLKFTKPGYGSGKANPFFGKAHSDETKCKFKNRDLSYRKEAWYKEIMSQAVAGQKNPMYGKSVYDVWVVKYGCEKAKELLEEWKKKQSINSTGENNPMYGKPTPQGSGNGWSGWYNGVYFRSLRELSYMVGLDEAGIEWSSAERVRIKYVNWDGVERTYCPDFLVQKHLLVEIKPTRLRSSKTAQLKQQAAELYCNANDLKYEIIDPGPLPAERVKILRNVGSVKFIDRYEKLFKERYASD